MRKKLWMWFVCGALAVIPGSCNRETDQKTVKIGVMTPLTGEVASWGDMQSKSTELALDDLKAKGTLDGTRIQVVYEDDTASPKDGVNAFRKLADVDKVPIVVGSPASTVTLAAAPIANEKKLVLLSSGSTATEVANAGPYVFRIMPSDEVQASIMADWMLELGYKNVAIIYVENAWGKGLVEQFKTDFVKKGGKILAIESSKPDTSDFRAQLSKLESLTPESIYAPLYTRGAGLMIRQAREMGFKQQIFGADVYGTPELVEAGGDAVNGVLYTTFGQNGGTEYQQFTQRYKAKYGREPETYACYCYDAFLIAVEAIKRIPEGKPKDGSNIREALLSIKDFQGVTGQTTFDGKNNATGKTFDKLMIIDKKHVPFNLNEWKDRIH